MVASLRAGAEAVVDKAMSFEKVVATLRLLADGGELIPSDQRKALIEALDQRSAGERERLRPFAELTDREGHVLRRLIDGDSPSRSPTTRRSRYPRFAGMWKGFSGSSTSTASGRPWARHGRRDGRLSLSPAGEAHPVAGRLALGVEIVVGRTRAFPALP